MKPTPTIGRFKSPELQEAYEAGFAQEHDHDPFVLLDRFSWLLDQADTSAAGTERMAAMLEGPLTLCTPSRVSAATTCRPARDGQARTMGCPLSVARSNDRCAGGVRILVTSASRTCSAV
jgi:hypothetical protein